MKIFLLLSPCRASKVLPTACAAGLVKLLPLHCRNSSGCAKSAVCTHTHTFSQCKGLFFFSSVRPYWSSVSWFGLCTAKLTYFDITEPRCYFPFFSLQVSNNTVATSLLINCSKIIISNLATNDIHYIKVWQKKTVALFFSLNFFVPDYRQLQRLFKVPSEINVFSTT